MITTNEHGMAINIGPVNSLRPTPIAPAFAGGMDGYLSKPLGASELFFEIAAAVKGNAQLPVAL